VRPNDTLREAKRLYALGFAIHWLHPKSKRPIESGWTTGPRKDWKYLTDTYSVGYNLGVRLGSASHIPGQGYLAVVDVDVKSTDERHRKEAVKAAKSLLLGSACPVVMSGRGNGSRHYYCVTGSPFKTWNPAQSDERVKVYMPSKKPSKRELEDLSEAEIAQGLRMAPAWEISLYSDGRQVVLPPSIHPDSQKPYTWAVPVTSVESLPLVNFEGQAMAVRKKEKSESSGASPFGHAGATDDLGDFQATQVDLSWLEISDRIKNGIVTGEGVGDRSGFLLPASNALLSAGLSRDEILSVLTDKKTFLGACAYDHAKTTDQERAARWVWKYTLKKVMEERDAVSAFKAAAKIEPVRTLTPEETAAQNEEMESESDWRSGLEKTAQGKYRNTLNNCKTIITNVCPQKNVVGRNEFAANDFYLCDTPWRSMQGEGVSDIDIVRIKFYCCERFGIEFGDNTINQALLEIADLHRFHPVRDWLKSLKWDGVHRIDTWLRDHAGAVGPEPYLSEVSRKVLVAMIKRVFEPGCKFDHVLILEGLQGVGKSTLLRKLAGDAWFSDATLNIGDKDAVLTMQSKWLIELGELSAMGRADLEQLKAFITQTTDRIRAPYGKRVEEFPRQCVFIGSTNLDEYLRDLTGNRRFWPVKVLDIKFDGIASVREQLFAEALQYYRLGEPLYLDDAGVAEQAVLEQGKRSATDEWVSIVSDILSSPGFPVGQFEMRDVAKRMDQVGAHKLTHSDVQRLTRCFKLLECTSWRESIGQRRRLWKYGFAVQGPSKAVQGTLDGKSPMIENFY
jgi:predicted P-loop ATPase